MMILVELKETSIESIFFQKKKFKIIMYSLMVETFMTNQLVMKSVSMMELEKF